MRALSREAPSALAAALALAFPAAAAAQALRLDDNLVAQVPGTPAPAAEPAPLPLRLDRALRPREPARPVPPPPPAPQRQGLIASVRVNEQDKGEHVVYQGTAGDFFVRRDDLDGWMRLPRGLQAETIEGEAFVPLSAIPHATVRFDEAALVLRLAFPPEAFPGQVIAYQATARPKPTRSDDVSALLNYQLGHGGATTGESSNSWSATAEGSLRWREWLLRSTALYSHSTAETQALRGLTTLSREDVGRLTRVLAGDVTTALTDITGGVVLGGIGYARSFELDPYLVRSPTASFRTAVELPSQVDVYVGETRIHRQVVGPGPLELGNLTYLTGRRDIRVVVRDIFGREREVSFPFYFADRGLASGLQDFSYVVGAVRRNVATRSADYGEAAFSAMHRVGVNDALTLGAQAEGTGDFANAGFSAVLRGDVLGVLSATALASRDRDAGSGIAAAIGWSFQRGGFSAALAARRASREFASLTSFTEGATGAGAGPAVRDDTATLAWSPGRWGTISASLHEVVPRVEPRSRTASLGYSVPFGREWLLQATWRHTTGFAAGRELFVGLQYIPSPRITTFTGYREDRTSRTASIQVGNLVPEGEGVGYRLGAEVSDTPDGPVRTLSPELTWHGRYATVQANASHGWRSGGGTGLYDVSVRGALAYVGGTVGLARPIDDSFAVARIDPPIPNVRVYLNQQESGRTDAAGRAFLPRVVSYVENHVGIDDRDVPIEHALEEKGRTLVPYSRSGTVVTFKAPLTRAISGTLAWRRAGRPAPAEFVMIVLAVDGRELEVPTGRGGEFYFENVPAGDYPAHVEIAGRACAFTLHVPRSDETLVRIPAVLACDVP